VSLLQLAAPYCRVKAGISSYSPTCATRLLARTRMGVRLAPVSPNAGAFS
jgi:hypothetical protein